jgi:hypothetical protein
MGGGASTETVDEAVVTKGQAIVRGKQSRKQIAKMKEEQERAAAGAAAATGDGSSAEASTKASPESDLKSEAEASAKLDMALISLSTSADGSEFILAVTNAVDSSEVLTKVVSAKLVGGEATLYSKFIPRGTAELEPVVAEVAAALSTASEVVFMADVATLAGQALLALVLPSL